MTVLDTFCDMSLNDNCSNNNRIKIDNLGRYKIKICDNIYLVDFDINDDYRLYLMNDNDLIHIDKWVVFSSNGPMSVVNSKYELKLYEYFAEKHHFFSRSV